ncbi:galactosylgalactosylxylosylprotein 3-beta-glucuronosyltransferase 1 [Octopus sinensis]|uniref:Galactosylgalactosylxylosylprotein 3-beta-glucuronosyltransferase n=1 Tax=Octopus sinensis TaxID=2607531 RepID=A0A6P7SX90_9MOLL|nr:galactosylgalactosylxylosylprotein 3-beta-glucuronosyltransferase 1 [Octopus sinensis]
MSSYCELKNRRFIIRCMIFGLSICIGSSLLGLTIFLNENTSIDERKLSLLTDCQQKLKDRDDYIFALKTVHKPLKQNRQKEMITIFAITPTYSRLVQKAELTRLSQTFLHIPNFHWIIVEDSSTKTTLVTNFLKESNLNYTHLNIKTPDNYKLKPTDPNWLKPRGVLQRNLALNWLRENIDINTQKGVLYFADDDNTYSLKVFEEMRDTKVVSVWPVGLVGGLRYEKPIIENGKVVGWFTHWEPKRPFAMDMAGFAINLERIFHYKNALFTYKVPRGYQESVLLKHLGVTISDLEPKADLCTKILVWHTQTVRPKLKNEIEMKKKTGHGSDINIEL